VVAWEGAVEIYGTMDNTNAPVRISTPIVPAVSAGDSSSAIKLSLGYAADRLQQRQEESRDQRREVETSNRN